MSDMKPKEKAARKPRGFLSARQLADIREIAIIARDTGISLTLHGVTAGNQDQCSTNSSQLHSGSLLETNTMHLGRGQKSTDSVDDACEKPTKQQLRSARRREDFLLVKRAAPKWLSLMQKILLRSRAKLRSDVWTERMRSKLALREKMQGFFRRAWTHGAQQRALASATPTRADESVAVPSCTTEDDTVFGPSSYLDDEAAYEAEEEEMLQAAIAASLASAPADTPPDDHGANRASQPSAPCTPPGLRSLAPKQEQPVKQAGKRSSKKTRNGRSSKPLQPANRG